MSACYCSLIRPFTSKIQFVILIHPSESRRSIATGRMSHLCIANSLLLEGIDFSENEQINQILNDPLHISFLLFPHPNAINLNKLSQSELSRLTSSIKQLFIFILDGTWFEVKKMFRLSHNINTLPMICLQPEKPSSFIVRKQPADHCLSTIEAIHQVISTCCPAAMGHLQPQDTLLEVFNDMVKRQMDNEAARINTNFNK